MMSMKPGMRALGRLWVLAAVLVTAVAQAQAPVNLDGFWNVKKERKPSGTELFAKIPKGAVFIDDAGAGELAKGDYAGLQLSEAAKAAIKSYDFKSEFDRNKTCIAPSVVFYMQAPFPMEIHQADKLIVLKMEYFDMVRLIFMDGRKIPADAPLSKNGFSVGHWEGDELVVETGRIEAGTFMNNGFNHSDNIKMTERFKLSKDGKTLWLIQIYEDPEVFKGQSARYMAFSKQAGQYVFPYECDPFFFGR